MDLSEKRFEQDIENYLVSHGYEQFSYLNPDGHRIHKYVYDKDKALYLEVLVNFIAKSQPKAWARYVKLYGDEAPSKLYRRLQDSVAQEGLIHVLRHGITDLGINLKLCYFKPESTLNEASQALYDCNIVGVTRQFAYSKENNNTIDLALSLNGIPLVAFELKNQFMGQNYSSAITQFKEDRSPKEFCFKLNNRFLVYFAIDLYEAWMTTELKGEHTYFLPFNQGNNGAGKSGGKGNPQNPNGYMTSYIWEEVFSRDSFIELVHRFISYREDKEVKIVGNSEKTITTAKLIFPRYHQYDVVNKLMASVRDNGAGTDYLIEHSAGSGKSNSIAWIAYRLASIHDDDNNPIYNSVIVVTNRVVLDSQLQDTIKGFDHTPGLVEAIDEKKRSRGLTEAINDKKRIIICTIQKFLFAYKDFDDMSGRRFAIIVDEAHDGQSGESAKALKRSLIDRGEAITEFIDEEDINADEINETDELLMRIIAQGHHKNQSFFAFTATPKNKTIELFCTFNPATGKREPFHTYSMRQAIEEGFILDVLANYTTIDEAFKIVKVSQDNPELLEGKTAKALVKYYKSHGHTIDQKTEMIMANFLEHGRFKINGKGKAMIVADSRHNAVRYYFAIKKYIEEHKDTCAGVNVLVAFSGMVKFDDSPIEYTEASLNTHADGRKISSDKALRRAFRSDEFKILVVANKYQTGFDEPLLHSMYVDKRLRDVKAVQTLSRLNRTCVGKEDTFVLDFVNKAEDIKKAFQPFYEKTILEGSTDYNAVYDLRTKISKFAIYDSVDVDRYCEQMGVGGKQDETQVGKLSSFLKSIVDRYLDLDDKERANVRNFIMQFNKNYAYITQLVRINDKDLFKEYLFTSHLIRFLPRDKINIIDITDKIKLEYASLKKAYEGQITLEKQDESIFKPKGMITKGAQDKKKDTLQSIIDKVNGQYNGRFTEADRVIIEGIYQMFMSDDEVKKFKKLAQNSNVDMFVKSLFPDKFSAIVSKCYLENNESFKKLFTDKEFYDRIMDEMAKEIYKSLRNDD